MAPTTQTIQSTNTDECHTQFSNAGNVRFTDREDLIVVTVVTSSVPAALQKRFIYIVVFVNISIASNKMS